MTQTSRRFLTQKPGLLTQARRKAGHGICVKFRRGFCVKNRLRGRVVKKVRYRTGSAAKRHGVCR